MARKLKLYNKQKFDVGIKLINPMREQNIKAGSFTIVEDDDIYYLDSICSLIKRGFLTFDDDEIKMNLGYIENKVVTKNDEEILAFLKGGFLKMKSELASIKEPYLIDAVFKIAEGIADELSGSKIKYISEFCNRNIIDKDSK